jgi:hypothetical protein
LANIKMMMLKAWSAGVADDGLQQPATKGQRVFRLLCIIVYTVTFLVMLAFNGFASRQDGMYPPLI